MIIVDDLDEAFVLGIVGNSSIILFNEGAGKQLPGTGDGRRGFRGITCKNQKNWQVSVDRSHVEWVCLFLKVLKNCTFPLPVIQFQARCSLLILLTILICYCFLYFYAQHPQA